MDVREKREPAKKVKHRKKSKSFYTDTYNMYKIKKVPFRWGMKFPLPKGIFFFIVMHVKNSIVSTRYSDILTVPICINKSDNISYGTPQPTEIFRRRKVGEIYLLPFLILWDQFLLGHDIHFQMIRNKY